MVNAHLGELPELVDGLVVQPKASLDTIGIVSARHVPDLWAILVAEAVTVQVVDVGHVDGVLKHAPVVTSKLDLTCSAQLVSIIFTTNRQVFGALPCQLGCAKTLTHKVQIWLTQHIASVTAHHNEEKV